MSRTILATSVLSLVWCALIATNAAAERKADPEQLKVGARCEIAIKEIISENHRSQTIYVGTVKEFNVDSVTLQDVTLTVRYDRSTPVLRTIPYVKRFFRNVGIGVRHLGKKTVVVSLNDIISIETVTAEIIQELPQLDVTRIPKVKDVLP